MSIPNDPVILLSYVNTQLRDFYPSLGEFCASAGCDVNEIQDKLKSIDYEYDADTNQFI